MCEPFSIIGTAAAAAQLSKSLYDIAKTVFGAPKEVSDVAGQLAMVSSILGNIKDVVEQRQELYKPRLFDDMSSTVDKTREMNAEVQKLIGHKKLHRLNPKNLKYVFKAKKVKEILVKVEGLKSSMSLVLMTMQLAREQENMSTRPIGASNELTPVNQYRPIVESLVDTNRFAIELLNQTDDELYHNQKKRTYDTRLQRYVRPENDMARWLYHFVYSPESMDWFYAPNNPRPVYRHAARSQEGNTNPGTNGKDPETHSQVNVLKTNDKDVREKDIPISGVEWNKPWGSAAETYQNSAPGVEDDNISDEEGQIAWGDNIGPTDGFPIDKSLTDSDSDYKTAGEDTRMPQRVNFTSPESSHHQQYVWLDTPLVTNRLLYAWTNLTSLQIHASALTPGPVSRDGWRRALDERIQEYKDYDRESKPADRQKKQYHVVFDERDEDGPTGPANQEKMFDLDSESSSTEISSTKVELSPEQDPSAYSFVPNTYSFPQLERNKTRNPARSGNIPLIHTHGGYHPQGAYGWPQRVQNSTHRTGATYDYLRSDGSYGPNYHPYEHLADSYTPSPPSAPGPEPAPAPAIANPPPSDRLKNSASTAFIEEQVSRLQRIECLLEDLAEKEVEERAEAERATVEAKRRQDEESLRNELNELQVMQQEQKKREEQKKIEQAEELEAAARKMERTEAEAKAAEELEKQRAEELERSVAAAVAEAKKSFELETTKIKKAAEEIVEEAKAAAKAAKKSRKKAEVEATKKARDAEQKAAEERDTMIEQYAQLIEDYEKRLGMHDHLKARRQAFASVQKPTSTCQTRIEGYGCKVEINETHNHTNGRLVSGDLLNSGFFQNDRRSRLSKLPNSKLSVARRPLKPRKSLPANSEQSDDGGNTSEEPDRKIMLLPPSTSGSASARSKVETAINESGFVPSSDVVLHKKSNSKSWSNRNDRFIRGTLLWEPPVSPSGSELLRSLKSNGWKPIYMRTTGAGETWYIGNEPFHVNFFTPQYKPQTAPPCIDAEYPTESYGYLVIGRDWVNEYALKYFGFQYRETAYGSYALDPRLSTNDIDALVALTMSTREVDLRKLYRDLASEKETASVDKAYESSMDSQDTTALSRTEDRISQDENEDEDVLSDRPLSVACADVDVSLQRTRTRSDSSSRSQISPVTSMPCASPLPGRETSGLRSRFKSRDSSASKEHID